MNHKAPPISTIARIAGVSTSDVSNYYAGEKRRERYVAPWKREAIEKAAKMSQTELILWHFDRFGARGHLTQSYAGTHYHIGRLSERVRELNRRWERTGDPRRIRNTQPLGVFGVQAEYILEEK